MEEKFETLLLHLGQDIGYMGLRVQKDMQKCLKDLRATKDHKKFCNKVADILKKFSEFTVQYSKDLTGRITEYQKEGDFTETIEKLQEIGGVQKSACNVCKINRKGAETSNSLGPPGNNNEEEFTELTKNEVPDEVLSQYSLHINSEDEVKSEQLTQIQSSVLENDVPTNDVADTTAKSILAKHHPTQLEPNDKSNSVNVDSSIVNSRDNDTMSEQENDHNDSDIANSLEISHSEEVLSNEDPEEEVIFLSDASEASNMVTNDQSEYTAELKEGPVKDHPVSSEEVAEDNNYDKSQKLGVIPLPYKPLYEKEQLNVQESTKSKDSDILQKINIIALPYKPLFEKEEKSSQESGFLNEDIAKSSNLKDEPTVENKENKLITDDNDDADVEIVSIASSHEDSDSDVEIIENVPQMSVPDQSIQNPTGTAKLKDDFNAKTVNNSDAETVKDTSPTINCSDTSPQGASSEETVVNEATLLELQNVVGNIDSDVETEKTNDVDGSERKNVAVEMSEVTENDEWDIETVANTSPQQQEGLGSLGTEDWDAATVTDSPARHPSNSNCNQAAVVTSSQETYSEEPNVNHTPPVERSSNDSDDTIIASPLNPALLESDKTADGSENINSGDVDSISKETKDDKAGSDSDDNIYTAATQKGADKSQESVVENDNTDPDGDFDTATQVVLHNRFESSEKSANVTSGGSQQDHRAAGSVNDDLIGLPGVEVTEMAAESPKEGELQEAMTQDIDIPESQAIAEDEDVVMESDDAETQESYVFDLEDNQASEEITQEKVPETMEEANHQNNKESQESFVFDIGKEQGDTGVSSVTVDTLENPSPAVHGSVAPPDDKDEQISRCDDVQDGENLSVSEFNSGTDDSDSDIDGTRIKSKRKLKDKDRKSLLKVIADFFSKRKKAKEAVEDKDENHKKPRPTKRRKNTPVKTKGRAETKNPKAKTKREKKLSTSGKGDRDAKEYLDFLNARRIDEASNSSTESVKDDVIIQEDSLDSSDVDNTQIENSDKLPGAEECDFHREKTIEESKSDDEDSNDSIELFKSSQKPNVGASINAKDSEDLNEVVEDPDRTQKVDDLRKLRQIGKESVDKGGVNNQPTENVCGGDATEGSPGDVEDQVVSPFKRKIVRPLSSTQSDDEDALNRDTESHDDDDVDNQIVSPFKKKGVKRLHSSDESDSEPPKMLEAEGTQESDGSTQEIKRFKRICVKRLLSTEGEVSDTTQKASSDNEEDEMELGRAKRRKVQRLPSSERCSSAELMATGKKAKEESSGCPNETEMEEETSEENDRQIEPSRFKLDDKARDDFLDMFDKDSSNDSEKDGANEEPVEVERDENGEDESSQFKLGDGDRDNLLNLLTDKENEERDANNKEGRVDSPSLLRNREENKLTVMLNELNDDSERSAAEPPNASSKEEDKVDESSQFKLNSKARDEFLDLLNGELSDDSRDHDDSGEKTLNKDGKSQGNDDKEGEDVDQIEPSQFKLDAKARDEFLDLLNGEPSSDSKDQDEQQSDSSSRKRKRKSDKGGKSRENKEEENDNADKTEFKLSSAARDELLDMLTSERGDDSIAKDDQNSDKEINLKKDDINTHKSGLDKHNDEFTKPDRFKLNDKARDEFLEMLSSDHQSDNKNDGNDEVPRLKNANTDQSKDTLNGIDIPNDADTLKDPDNNNKDTPSDKDTIGNRDNSSAKDEDDFGDTENSQGIDDIDESDADENETNDKDRTAAKLLQFKLDEHEEDELLNLLSDHFKKTEKDCDLDSSDSDKASDEETGDGSRRKKKSKKVKEIDKDMLLELLKEFENTVKDKIENGDMEVDKMDVEHGDAKSDFHEDSGADSDPVLFDLLREETVEMSEEFGRRGRKRDTRKAAWNAYEQLLKDTEGLSDDSSSEISDIDIDDLELDLSDKEKKQKERAVNANLRKRFNVDKELVVDVEQTDISSFDLSSLSRRGGKSSSKIDRLCDISNVLQKRKKQEKIRQKAKLPRPSSSDSGSSESDDYSSVPSSPSRWSDYSLRANEDSTSYRDSFHLSDDNAEQDKLANALWENIKNSSDDNSGWSSDDDTDSSDEDKRKGKKSVGVGGKKGKGKNKKSDGKEEEEGTTDDDDTSSGEESSDESDVGGESGDKEKKEKALKDADLDSSDEDDFVGVRKGAWKFDPLLKGCLSSDESDFESDSSLKKARSSARIKRKMKQIQGDGSNEKSDAKKDSNITPTKDIISSDTDSDVEFVMEKEKTPKKPIVIDDEVEDDSPSKTGKGRRNIRALVEDDELAEATKKAKKEETERIKRLQEREKAKETYSQSQSFGSQLSEDEGEPLLLDVNEKLQIKVHPKITKKLKPHQRSGIQFMWDSCYESVEQLKKGYEGSGCILAHCMGLGKTLQALGLIHTVFNYKQVTKAKHVLVVCPLSTVSNWRNEYKLAYKDIRHCNIKLFTIQDKKVAGQRFSIVKNWWKNGGILVMGYECFGLLTNDQKLEKMAKKIFCNKEEMLEALVNPGPDLVICDEGHLLRNKQTQRNLALNKVTTKRRVVLTGTPLQNNLLEYYYMVHFVKPNLLGTEKEFKTNFINPISNGQFEDSTAVDILFMKKRTHVLHKILNKTVQRVEDTELKRYLPELVDQALFVRLSDLQVQFYNTYLDGANARPVEYTAAGNISRKNFLGDIQVLRYICTHPDVVTIAKRCVKTKIKEQDVIDDIEDAIEDKFFSKGDWFKELVPESGVKQPELGTKMMMALGIVEEAIAANDKVEQGTILIRASIRARIVHCLPSRKCLTFLDDCEDSNTESRNVAFPTSLIFSQTHAEMDSLEFFLKAKLNFKKGIDYNRMDGTISPEVRTHMCDTFNDKKNKRLRVFIMSTKVGGLGLNLTAANRVIIMNVNWNPSYDTQSVFRAFRFGQNKAVYVYRLIAIDTMEEKMYQRQVTKLAVAHRVVDKHQITRHYSAADIQEFYSVRPTTLGERPLPNVPEDRVLAKLIQKFQFLYKWHEHQALLANRPEEDLNEQQKNAAWEEFNKRAVEPPPPVPGAPPSMPQFVSVSSILNQPGPSGIQNRLNTGWQPYPKDNRSRRKSKRLNEMLDPVKSLHKTYYTYVPPKTLPVLIKQTPFGPKLVVQSHGRIPEREGNIRYGPTVPSPQTSIRPASAAGRPATTDRPAMTVSVLDVNTGVQTAPVDASRADDAARKIQEINSLIMERTTSELFPGFNAAAPTNVFSTSRSNSQESSLASRIDEINSIISASLGRSDAVSSQEWADDGMNSILLSMNLPGGEGDSNQR